MSDSKCHIPKIIHQTWKDENIPDKWEESPREWKRLYPTWEYKLWTDSSMREFMAEHYPDYLEMYDNYKYTIQRCDAFRYFVLFHYGGIYSDLDIVPTCNFEFLFQNTDTEVYLPMTQNILSFTNCLMASTQKAPFWIHLHKLLRKRSTETKAWWTFGKHFATIFKTGPQLLTFSVETYNNTIGLLPRSIISQDMTNPDIKNRSFTRALVGQSWNEWDSHFLAFFYVNRKYWYANLGLLFIYLVYLFLFYRNFYVMYS